MLHLRDFDALDQRLWDETKSVESQEMLGWRRLHKLCEWYGIDYSEQTGLYAGWKKLILAIMASDDWIIKKKKSPTLFWMKVLADGSYEILPSLSQLIKTALATPLGSSEGIIHILHRQRRRTD